MKRKSPVAKSLVKNSKAAIFAALEIHNKPVFAYRYEVVVILFINAWELLLKAYIYKYQKTVKLFFKDGKTKPFLDCLGCVTSNLDKNYKVLEENLIQIYKFRNEISHFHTEDLDILIFSLLNKNIILYKKFMFEFFNIDISSESNLILMPIGFKKPFSPVDFLSNESFISKSSKYVKDFIGEILESTAKLKSEGIEESILVEYNMSLINEKRIKNADIIAGINNEKNTELNLIINNIIKKPLLSNDVKATLVKSSSFTVPPNTDQEEISSWIALRVKDPKNLPSKDELWRLYSIRNEIDLQNEHVTELVRYNILREIPVFFWLKILKSEEIKKLLMDIFNNIKVFSTKTYILHISAFLGKSFYDQILKKFSGNLLSRIDPKSRNYPSSDPKILFNRDTVENEKRIMKIKSEEKFKQKIEEELTSIALRGAEGNPDAYDIFKAKSFDCYLYALSNKYK